MTKKDKITTKCKIKMKTEKKLNMISVNNTGVKMSSQIINQERDKFEEVYFIYII